MQNLETLLEEIVAQKSLIEGIIHQPRKKNVESPFKVVFRPLEIKGNLKYQLTYYYVQKTTHSNIDEKDLVRTIQHLLENEFKQGLFHTISADYHILLSKKNAPTILNKKPTKGALTLQHNRPKNYLLPDNAPLPFLVELGVMDVNGKVYAKKYDKFRQINRFLEMIEDVIPSLDVSREISIVDFGCGKSYLTFALNHYLTEICHIQVKIMGLDLKKEVIANCNDLAQKLKMSNLKFAVGNIEHYKTAEHVDMVICLHACDTATDAALYQAILWKADVIMAVPCCQHELFNQIENIELKPLLKHGILRERFSALATDALRAQLLEISGYKTQVMEFIETEHTPKNLLIRAVKQKQVNKGLEEMKGEYAKFKQALNAQPYLEKLLKL